MALPYRTRRRLQNLGIAAMLLLLLAILVWLVWLFWLDRYVIYTPDGAKLDFSLSAELKPGELAQKPSVNKDIIIDYKQEDPQAPIVTEELTPLRGYYIDDTMLRQDMDTVFSQLELLPAGTPVLLDLKHISGRFYYSTAIEGKYVEAAPGIDVDAVDELIEMMMDQNLYTIARIPAFRDRMRGLEDTRNGLYHPSGSYLWQDETRCYWMNPTKDGTLAYILEIVSELRAMGFDEIVFSDFRFPDTDNIRFYDDRDEAIRNAAQQMKTAAATRTFAVSFQSGDTAFPLPDGRTRLYIPDMNAAEVAEFVTDIALDNAQSRLVFLTDSRDTRFDDFSVMRPITSEIIVIEEENT